ncbi:PKD domain-containing protein, partial [candidate division KSB1 bacterium]|nr:PKD domain-containing protein [candidate division KSB1 bacterium]
MLYLKRNRIFVVISYLIFLSLLLGINSCEQRKHTNPFDPDYEGATQASMNKENRTGTLKLIPGSLLKATDLKVVTFSNTSDIEANGQFSVQTNEADKYQILLINGKTSNRPVYLGLYNPVTQKTMANDTSTALSLVLFNPYLVYTTQAQRTQYLEAVKKSVKFAQLLTLLKNAHLSNANMVLDYNTNPIIYQTICQLMKEALASLNVNGTPAKPIATDPPTIKDAPGDDIIFVNPRQVYYAAGIDAGGNKLKEVVTVNRKPSILSYEWGWPPVIKTSSEETNYSLGDGNFKLYLTKGGDFTKLNQWSDPEGRATILNTGQMIIYLMELIIGNLPTPNFTNLSEYFQISATDAYKLTAAINQQDPEGFLIQFFNLLSNNSEDITNWIWQQKQAGAAYEYFAIAMTIFEKVNFVVELFGFGSEQGPFVWDLIFAQKDKTYLITQSNGSLTSIEQNFPPKAQFTINPPAGIVTTLFTFNATTTTDDHDAIANLKFRWDWQSDGTWDTDWKSAATATHTFSEAGAYTITLEARDTAGLIGSVTHIVNVGGGAGTANHVKLFQDNLPWNSNSMVTMLENLGFTAGTGPNTYEIIKSSQMDSVPLIPGKDLVIIANDQNQTFYNNYAAVQVRLTNFVYMGGSLFWEACDQGWAQGSMVKAGVVLPGNLITDFDYDNNNYISNP